MSVDEKTVRRIAALARLAIPENEISELSNELNVILGFIDKLNEVDITGIRPMTSVVETDIKRREDVVTDGGYADKIIANAPVKDDHYFAVPKVVE